MNLTKRSTIIICILVSLIVVITGTTPAAYAQDSVVISNPRARHTFGERIIFEADLQPGIEPKGVYLTFQTSGSHQSVVLPATLVDDSLVEVAFDVTNQNPLPAFSTLLFWFTLELADGSQIQSETVEYLFTDNRYDWQSLQIDTNTDINWVEGDLTLAQAVKDVILQHKEDFIRYLELPYPDKLHIYIYPSVSSFQSALKMSNISWAAGHANPDQNTILVAIPTGFDQQLAIQQQIPHEIAHIRLSQYLEGNSELLPAWFSEGIASLAESFTAPEYWQILQNAYQKDTLIPVGDLCDTFPYDSDQAALAYAESESFVRYLQTRFGKTGLQALLDAYKDGQNCQNGVSTALGHNLERLEADWYKATFNQGLVPRSVGAILAWILLLVLVFAAPVGLLLVTSRRNRRKT